MVPLVSRSHSWAAAALLLRGLQLGKLWARHVLLALLGSVCRMGHYDQSYVFSPGNASGRGCQHSTAPLKADNDSRRTNTLVS